jgi:hypothetical protein
MKDFNSYTKINIQTTITEDGGEIMELYVEAFQTTGTLRLPKIIRRKELTELELFELMSALGKVMIGAEFEIESTPMSEEN